MLSFAYHISNSEIPKPGMLNTLEILPATVLTQLIGYFTCLALDGGTLWLGLVLATRTLLCKYLLLQMALLWETFITLPTLEYLSTDGANVQWVNLWRLFFIKSLLNTKIYVSCFTPRPNWRS